MHAAHLRGPFPGGDARLGAGDRGFHHIAPLGRSGAQIGQRRVNRHRVACGAPGVQPCDLFGLNRRVHHHDAAVFAHQRAGFAIGPAVDAHNNGLIPFYPAQAGGVAVDKARFHIVNRPNRAAHAVKLGQFGARAVL